MATKNNPGPFDCFSRAEPDEPMFVLLGRDAAACLTVVFWVRMRLALGQPLEDPQIEEARECSRKMEKWAKSKGKDVEAALRAFEKVVVESAARVSA